MINRHIQFEEECAEIAGGLMQGMNRQCPCQECELRRSIHRGRMYLANEGTIKFTPLRTSAGLPFSIFKVLAAINVTKSIVTACFLVGVSFPFYALSKVEINNSVSLQPEETEIGAFVTREVITGAVPPARRLNIQVPQGVRVAPAP